ncbi:hypothetical protein V8E53_004076 [Lactarius tabidus]
MHHVSWMDGRSCLKSSFNNKYRRVTGKASSTLLYFCQRAAYRRFGVIHPGFVTMIDTGTTQVVVPCDFDTPACVTSSPFSGNAFQISPSTFNLGPESSGFSTCIGGFGATDNQVIWVIGNMFLQNVYTLFDLGNNRFGSASRVISFRPRFRPCGNSRM